jgi:predicted TIM-barrel fold metal-dependent hydrolase
MIDAHVHIGQFNQMWYEPALVIRTALQAGVEKIVFTSTSTCGENVKYADVEKEIAELLSVYGYGSQTIRPFLWYRPDYHQQGLGVVRAMQTLPYSGIKIHPRAQNWDISDKNTLSILHELFGYADQKGFPVLIHTGYDKIDEADKFSRFFPEYPHAKITLAHCRPFEQAIRLLSSNSNVFIDTAFVPKKDIQSLIAFGLGSRIVLGSDFPITHYHDTEQNKIDKEKDFSAQLNVRYLKDLQSLSMVDKLADGMPFRTTNAIYFNEGTS